MSKIDRALQTAVKPGAQVTLPKMSVPGVGAVAAIIDPQENICGLWQQEVSA
jgi:predicted enzyme related to lactoylglutathione lyase